MEKISIKRKRGFQKGNIPWNSKGKSWKYPNKTPKEVALIWSKIGKYKITVKEFEKLTKNGCCACGWKLTFDLHHKDGNKKNDALDNIVCLCPNCHSLVHRLKIDVNTLL
tara:strand:+ start:2904 stop:3233 length:330 start_codon:yes stop_codon:yes gene_type:complete